MAADSIPASQNGFTDDGADTPREPREPRGVVPNPLIDDLKENHLRRGVLIPLKTTQEVRQDHTIIQALITRAPTKSANDVIM
jgi:tRNA-specific adenosine deaminase 3